MTSGTCCCILRQLLACGCTLTRRSTELFAEFHTVRSGVRRQESGSVRLARDVLWYPDGELQLVLTSGGCLVDLSPQQMWVACRLLACTVAMVVMMTGPTVLALTCAPWRARPFSWVSGCQWIVPTALATLHVPRLSGGVSWGDTEVLSAVTNQGHHGSWTFSAPQAVNRSCCRLRSGYTWISPVLYGCYECVYGWTEGARVQVSIDAEPDAFLLHPARAVPHVWTLSVA